jgi:hypothetical protein
LLVKKPRGEIQGSVRKVRMSHSMVGFKKARQIARKVVIASDPHGSFAQAPILADAVV